MQHAALRPPPNVVRVKKGVESRCGQPDTLNNYASVVLANVPANQMSQAGMEAVNNFVQTHGGGLVVSGGDQAYGPGLYARTPLEGLLPVRADLRGNSLQTGVGLVLVIDTSGSMRQDVGGTTIN